MLTFLSTDNNIQYNLLSYINHQNCWKMRWYPLITDNSVLIVVLHFFLQKIAPLREKRTLTSLNKEKCEEHPRSNLEHNLNVPRSHEEQTPKFWRKWRVELRRSFPGNEAVWRAAFWALSRLGNCLLNPLSQGRSGIAPDTSWNTLRTNQGSESGRLPEYFLSWSRFLAESDYPTFWHRRHLCNYDGSSQKVYPLLH